jgi:hypothetical protein
MGYPVQSSIIHTFTYTVNVDCVKFEYVVLAKYHHVAVLHSNRIFNHVNKSASYIVISTRILV